MGRAARGRHRGLYGLAVVRRDVGIAYSRRELGIMLRFGLPLVPAGIAFWGLALLDRFILQRLSDLEEVGIYGSRTGPHPSRSSR